MARYLFSCECGQQHVVDDGQAGTTIACSCGRNLEVPKLRVLRTLPPAVDAARARRGSTWTPWHGVAMAGLLVALVAGSLAYMLSSRIITPKPEEIDSIFEKSKPHEIWAQWLFLRKGPDQPIDLRTQHTLKDQSERNTLHYIALGISVLGAVTAIGAGVLAKKQSSGRKP